VTVAAHGPVQGTVQGTVLGIDLGGTKLLAVGLDASGREVYRRREMTGRGLGPELALALIAEIVDDARRALGGLDAVGLGFPGLVDHHRGVARSSVMLDGWHEVALAAQITARVGAPCAIDNDVNVAALHELALRGSSALLFVAVGTGIGGALVLDGKLWRGAHGLAGEIGHVAIARDGRPCNCGRRGCVNRYASGTAIDYPDGQPDGRPDGGLADATAALGAAIGSALNLLDVPLVVLGGGVAERGPTYLEAVAAHARRECFREIGEACTFELARGGYDAAALGAALLARQARHAASSGAIRERT
jgi:glucokinase